MDGNSGIWAILQKGDNKIIKDVEGLKKAIELAAYDLKYGTWVAKPLSKRKVLAIIDRFTIKEPEEGTK